VTLTLLHHADPDAYRESVDTYLHANLGACNQLFTVVHSMTNIAILQRQSWLASLQRDGQTCGLAVIHSALPLRSMIVSDIDSDGAGLIVDAIVRAGIRLTDITGPQHSIDLLIGAVQPPPRTNLRARLGNHLLDKTPVIPNALGSWRAAQWQDKELLLQWERAFLTECGFPVIDGLVAGVVENRLETGSTLYRLWEIDATPAAMAVGKLLPPTARIGPVYTAPAFRGRGCAGALVAHLSGQLMAGGADAVSLFTDLANPVSNRVYRRLGFRQIGEFVHIDIDML
jgi:ribosomal protein S18 acetylase RimI-like enzyme